MRSIFLGLKTGGFQIKYLKVKFGIWGNASQSVPIFQNKTWTGFYNRKGLRLHLAPRFLLYIWGHGGLIQFIVLCLIITLGWDLRLPARYSFFCYQYVSTNCYELLIIMLLGMLIIAIISGGKRVNAQIAIMCK